MSITPPVYWTQTYSVCSCDIWRERSLWFFCICSWLFCICSRIKRWFVRMVSSSTWWLSVTRWSRAITRWSKAPTRWSKTTKRWSKAPTRLSKVPTRWSRSATRCSRAPSPGILGTRETWSDRVRRVPAITARSGCAIFSDRVLRCPRNVNFWRRSLICLGARVRRLAWFVISVTSSRPFS